MSCVQPMVCTEALTKGILPPIKILSKSITIPLFSQHMLFPGIS